jgi:hypothetical protein
MEISEECSVAVGFVIALIVMATRTEWNLLRQTRIS